MNTNHATVSLHINSKRISTTYSTADADAGRPNGLAHVHLDDAATLVIGEPALALALADALQDAARVLRRNQLQQRLSAVAS